MKLLLCPAAVERDSAIRYDVGKQSEFFLADGIVITGYRTGEPPDLNELSSVRKTARVPVVLGSGMAPDNLGRHLPLAAGLLWDPRIKAFVAAPKAVRIKESFTAAAARGSFNTGGLSALAWTAGRWGRKAVAAEDRRLDHVPSLADRARSRPR